MTADQQNPRIRVAAVIVDDDRILLVQHEKNGQSYWMLPGGGVDYGETLEESLRRELWEEARVAITVGPLILASDSVAPNGERHVVNLCFRCTIMEGTPGTGEDTRIVAVAYHPLPALERLNLRPDFARDLLRAIASPGAATYAGNIWRD